MRAAAIVLVALALGAPSALAGGWNAKGGHEPDTLRDVVDRWMFASPNVDPAKRMVYFNGWEGHGALSALGVPGTATVTLLQNSFDPNVGALGSSLAGQDYAFYAMLGEWLDCNGDGYVGFGEQGLFEYRAELLIPFPGNPCPADSVVPRPTIPLDWRPPHNDGKWVREMLPISWSFSGQGIGGSNDLNPWNLNDNGSRVWVDYGYPEDAQAAPKCQINPAPRGTFHSTGGTLSWADCVTTYRVTTLFDAAVDSAGLHQYSFADHPRDAQNSQSEANIANPWGTSKDPGAVQMWDCAAPRAVQESRYVEGWPVLSNRTVYVNVSQPSPGVGSTSGATPAGTTWGVISNCGTATGTTLADSPYALEGNVAQLTARIAPTGYMHPIEITRPVAPYAVALGPSTPPGPGDGDTGDGDLGVGLTTRNNYWTDNVNRRGEGPLLDTRSTSVSPPQRVSFYAYVSPPAVTKYGLTLPHGSTTGAYLAEACGTSTGVKNGWDCDGSHWWKTLDGAEAQPRVRYLGHEQDNPNACTPIIASNAFDYTNPSTTSTASRGCVSIAIVPGSPYNLRDLDCYDQSVAALRSAQVSWGTVTGSFCDPAP